MVAFHFGLKASEDAFAPDAAEVAKWTNARDSRNVDRLNMAQPYSVLGAIPGLSAFVGSKTEPSFPKEG